MITSNAFNENVGSHFATIALNLNVKQMVETQEYLSNQAYNVSLALHMISLWCLENGIKDKALHNAIESVIESLVVCLEQGCSVKRTKDVILNMNKLEEVSNAYYVYLIKSQYKQS